MNHSREFVGEGGDHIEAFMQELEGDGAGRESLSTLLCDSLLGFLSCRHSLLNKDLAPVFFLKWISTLSLLQLSATDVSARTTMKGAAKCDKHCELQNSVNQ